MATAVLGRWRHGVTKAECPLRDAEVMAWHADLSVEETGPRERPPRPRRLTFNVALTDMDGANGPMEVIPGSHRMHHDQTARWIGEIENIPAVSLLLRAGDCLLRDGNLLHRGTTNLTGRPRILLDQTYRAAG
jgi:ectoine hydroxylase-related dioxygenase (phytanoyl-CoA dioxygenase family)